ncbi:MAG: N-acetyl-gamma-glutamyl-phosphate reductase [Deltaproteobacteria bacterium]|nr:N-acetyl-gamma-glutamyl-phosphate reductase [Deltaproteobacteria bacterium]
MVNVAVIGGTGYAGAELVRILSAHPHAELTMITSRQHAGQPFSDVYPAMAGIVNLTCQAFSEESVSEAADVIFTAVPHKASMGVVPGLIHRGKKVIDLSADFRFKDPGVYEAWYEPHDAKDLLKTAVYGLPEFYSDEIRKTSLVGNPGCYPTSVLLPLLPLIKAPFIDCDSIIADSKSGTSGAGRSVSLITHFCEVNEAFKAYQVAEHRHNPEMDEVLSHFAERKIRVTFTPHLVPITRGMLTTIYVGLKEDVSTREVASCLESFYADKPFVRVYPKGSFPNTIYVRGTNYCDIGFQVAEGTKRLVLISVIDNLVKGASGQAVQNMNIMLGFPETAGLDQVPFPL